MNGFGGLSLSSPFRSSGEGASKMLTSLDVVAIFLLVGSGLCSNKVLKSLSVGSDSSGAVAKLSRVLVVSGVCLSCSVVLQSCSKSMVPKFVGCSVGSPPRKLLLRESSSSVVGVGAPSDSLESLGG